MVVTVVAIGTNDIISTYPLPQPCGFSLQLNQDYMTCPPDIDVSDAGHSEYGSELSNDSSKLEGGKMDCVCYFSQNMSLLSAVCVLQMKKGQAQ